MSKYKQKPVEVDARQYTGVGNNGPTLASWVTNESKTKQTGIWNEHRAYHGEGMSIQLESSFSIMEENGDFDFVPEGSWVVEIDGEFFSYTDFEFQKRFEKA